MSLLSKYGIRLLSSCELVIHKIITVAHAKGFELKRNKATQVLKYATACYVTTVNQIMDSRQEII